MKISGSAKRHQPVDYTIVCLWFYFELICGAWPRYFLLCYVIFFVMFKLLVNRIIIHILHLLYQGWRTFLSGGSNLRSQTEKRKNVGHGCNNINEGLERKFCRNLYKEQKKDLHLRNTQLPVFNATVWKNKLFFTTLFSLPFFHKIFLTTNGSLKCASGSLSDPRISGSPSLSYTYKNGV